MTAFHDWTGPIHNPGPRERDIPGVEPASIASPWWLGQPTAEAIRGMQNRLWAASQGEWTGRRILAAKFAGLVGLDTEHWWPWICEDGEHWVAGLLSIVPGVLYRTCWQPDEARGGKVPGGDVVRWYLDRPGISKRLTGVWLHGYVGSIKRSDAERRGLDADAINIRKRTSPSEVQAVLARPENIDGIRLARELGIPAILVLHPRQIGTGKKLENIPAFVEAAKVLGLDVAVWGETEDRWVWDVIDRTCGPLDINRDGVIDEADLKAFLAAFAAKHPAADFDGDGDVDVGDLLAYLSAFREANAAPGISGDVGEGKGE